MLMFTICIEHMTHVTDRVDNLHRTGDEHDTLMVIHSTGDTDHRWILKTSVDRVTQSLRRCLLRCFEGILDTSGLLGVGSND